MTRAFAALLLVSCSASGASPPADDAAAADAAPDGAAPGSLRLLEAPFSIGAGDQKWVCARVTPSSDLWITRFAITQPVQVHHTIFGLDLIPDADGVRDCPSDPELGWTLLYGTGRGTEPFELPPGIAVRIPAGKQAVLQMHLFNYADAPASGTVIMDIETLAADGVVHEAEAFLVGDHDFTIPANTPSYSTSGSCTLSHDATLFTLMPHMHQLGRHMTVTAETSEGERVLYDGDFEFEQQAIVPIPETPLRSGDRVEVRCTFENPTDQSVEWGQSSTEEMCHAGIYRYPPLGNFTVICDES